MNTENENELLSVKNLRVVYTSDGVPIHAVNGVSFSVEKGKTLGLVGETGAGKTSIAKAILGVLPEFSTKSCTGEIVFESMNLLALKEHRMAELRGQKIAMIFQDPMTALNPVMTVGNQIAEGIRIHNKVGKKKAKEMAEEMLEMVGIPAGRYKDYPHQFSGWYAFRQFSSVQPLLTGRPPSHKDILGQTCSLRGDATDPGAYPEWNAVSRSPR